MTINRGLAVAAAVVAILFNGRPTLAGLPVFPGAEGFGTDTPGGRGGKVLVVTNLDDAGPGSLREACETEGQRIVIFNVGGYVTLESDITIKHPFCTIAGQTAPGGGIGVRGGGLGILTHDVVMRQLRFRMGRLPVDEIQGFRDCVRIHGKPPSYNVVLDHCSISWGVSRDIITWNDAHDITVQWCIISESLSDPGLAYKAMEGKGFLIGDRTKRISVHHCLFAHNHQRNPRLKHGVHADIVNNVIYNWDDGGAHLIGDFHRKPDAPTVEANIVGNWYQAGVNTSAEAPVIQALTSARLHVAGNVSNHAWYVADLKESLEWITLQDDPLPSAPVKVLPVRQAYERVLAEAGATSPRRDAVDQRIVDEVRRGTGHYIRNEKEVGGWPELGRGQPWKDSDRDGMPDEWETRHHFSPNDPADAAGDNDGDGYTNIEEWINERAGPPRIPQPAVEGKETKAMPGEHEKKVYGVGILGNCCTHGAGVCRRFQGHPRTRVVAAFEKDPRRAGELQKRFGSPLAESYDAVIQHPDVDFVAVTCDPCDKAHMVEKAAAAGKPIFLNKPISESLDGARRIAAAVEKHDATFVYDIPMVRFVPVYARLLQEVCSGKYGKVMGYHHLFGMNFAPDFDLKPRWPERLDPPAKSGGGEMTNMGCYAIDYAVSLFGPPKAVTARSRKIWDVYAEADVENFGQIVLDYGNFFAFLEVGKQQLTDERRHSNSMTINFEHTTLHVDSSAKAVTVNHVPQDFDRFAAGADAVDSVEQLIAAIEQGTPPTSNVENAVLGTEVLMAAYRSIVERRTITLPLTSGANPLIPVP